MTKKEEQFKSIYQQYKDQIYRFCLGFVGETSEADILFQEVFVRLWNYSNTFKEKEVNRIWLFKLVSNTAILYMSRRPNYFSPKEDNSLNENMIHQGTLDYSQLNHHQLFKAISKLKMQDRIVIGLLFENFTYQDIADIVGISTSQVEIRIHQIKDILTNRLAS